MSSPHGYLPGGSPHFYPAQQPQQQHGQPGYQKHYGQYYQGYTPQSQAKQGFTPLSGSTRPSFGQASPFGLQGGYRLPQTPPAPGPLHSPFGSPQYSVGRPSPHGFSSLEEFQHFQHFQNQQN